MENQDITKILNQQVANWSLLYVKLHNYHWLVRGIHFYELHLKFEELYNEAALNVDQLAERILAVQGKPLATLKEFLAEASLKEATGTETPEQMIETLANDFEMLSFQLKDGIEVANQTNDDVTADLLTQIRVSVEKHLWMFRAFLG
ncbi:Dps family protein [Rubeoparvulum massiliense]|uniref:Dps family protein n=1 Tax=Rubeoparvulum massiliense TaxID=1631346 RepID=UPI00065E0AEB|nr:Dps family protein [Rubeoparvulum massiliense]